MRTGEQISWENPLAAQTAGVKDITQACEVDGVDETSLER